MDLSVQEAAALLGVHPSRVRQRLESGSLSGRRLAGRWLVEGDDVDRLRSRPSPRGRPAAPWRAWALLAMLEAARQVRAERDVEARSDGHSAWLSAHSASRSAVSQVRGHLASGELLDAPAEKWRSLLSSRSMAYSCHGHPAAIKRLLADPRAVPAGASLAAAAGADLVVVDAASEIYVPEQHFDQMISGLHLHVSPLPAGSGAELVSADDAALLRVPQGVWPYSGGRAWSVALAADLLESLDPRSAEAGRKMLGAAAGHAAELLREEPRGALSWVIDQPEILAG